MQPRHYLETALFDAIENHDVGNAQKLISLIQDNSGIASLAASNPQGDSFFIHAIRHKHVAIINLVLDAIKDTDIIDRPDANQRTPLQVAAQVGEFKSVTILINLYKDNETGLVKYINHACNEKHTPLVEAVLARYPSADIIATLLNHGATLDVIATTSSRLPEHFLRLHKSLHQDVFQKLDRPHQDKILKFYLKQVILNREQDEYTTIQSIYTSCASLYSLQVCTLTQLQMKALDQNRRSSTTAALICVEDRNDSFIPIKFSINKLQFFVSKIHENDELLKCINQLEHYLNHLRQIPTSPTRNKAIAVAIPIILWLAWLALVVPLSVKAVTSSDCGERPRGWVNENETPYYSCNAEFEKYAIPAGALGGVLGLLLLGYNFFQISYSCDDMERKKSYCLFYPYYKETNISTQKIAPHLANFQSEFLDKLTELKTWYDDKLAADPQAVSNMPLQDETLNSLKEYSTQLKQGGKITTVIATASNLLALMKQARRELNFSGKRTISSLYQEMLDDHAEVAISMEDDDAVPLLERRPQ